MAACNRKLPALQMRAKNRDCHSLSRPMKGGMSSSATLLSPLPLSIPSFVLVGHSLSPHPHAEDHEAQQATALRIGLVPLSICLLLTTGLPLTQSIVNEQRMLTYRLSFLARQRGKGHATLTAFQKRPHLSISWLPRGHIQQNVFGAVASSMRQTLSCLSSQVVPSMPRPTAQLTPETVSSLVNLLCKRYSQCAEASADCRSNQMMTSA